MGRLIDDIQTDINNKNILFEIEFILLTKASFEELLKDFEEEFEFEYMEIGRSPGKEDVQDYLNIPIIITNSILREEEKYKLLTKV